MDERYRPKPGKTEAERRLGYPLPEGEPLQSQGKPEEKKQPPRPKS